MVVAKLIVLLLPVLYNDNFTLLLCNHEHSVTTLRVHLILFLWITFLKK